MANAPSWTAERFDVVATMPGGADGSQVGDMLRGLLAERFMFRAHYETREQPIYSLVLARRDGRLGPQLRRSDVDCAALLAQPAASDAAPKGATVERCTKQLRTIGHVAIVGMPLEALANYLAAAVRDRVVVDRTGLSGHFDAELQFAPEGGCSRGKLPRPSTAVHRA